MDRREFLIKSIQKLKIVALVAVLIFLVLMIIEAFRTNGAERIFLIAVAAILILSSLGSYLNSVFEKALAKVVKSLPSSLQKTLRVVRRVLPIVMVVLSIAVMIYSLWNDWVVTALGMAVLLIDPFVKYVYPGEYKAPK